MHVNFDTVLPRKGSETTKTHGNFESKALVQGDLTVPIIEDMEQSGAFLHVNIKGLEVCLDLCQWPILPDCGD